MTNIANLVNIVSDKISNSTTSQEILYLSKALEKIKLGNVKVVSTYSDMTDTISSIGDVYFVESEESLYYDFFGYKILLLSTGSANFSWGYNVRGQLGDGTTTAKSSPVSVVGGFTDWVQVSAGDQHSLGIRANGTAWAWGSASYGRLGSGNTISRSSPVPVIGEFTDWIQLSGGYRHSLGLRENGTAWSWGQNNAGQLGTNSTTSVSSPVSVVGGFTDWIQLSAGFSHSLGVRENGTAWAWGQGQAGGLGDGTTTSRLSPVSVVGGFTDWTQVSAGVTSSSGIRADGSAWAWGSNSSGQLGDGTTTSRLSPVSVVGGFTDWVQVSSKSSRTLGVRADGSAWAWGYNFGGALGDGTTVSKSSPVSIIGGFTDWVHVEPSTLHSIGLRANGTVWAWGYNFSGRLGDGTTNSSLSPVSVVGGFTDWIQVSVGGSHNLGIRSII